MSNLFDELLHMKTEVSTIEQQRKDLNRLVYHMRNNIPNQREQIQFFSNLRKLPVSILDEMDSFMVDIDDVTPDRVPDEFHHDSYGFVKGLHLVYSGRYVFPVKDVKGDVMGFVGYDKFDQPKYLDSLNYGYKAKQTTMLGMEQLPKIYNDGYCFFTEGSICTAYLRSKGFNAMTTLGSYLSPYCGVIMNRLGRGAIPIPDSDDTGFKFKKQINRCAPMARVIRMKLAKDVDDSRLFVDSDGKNYEEELLYELESIIKRPFGRYKLIEV